MIVFLAIALSVGVCMVHAAFTRKWNLVQGGAPILGASLLLALVAAALG